MTYVAYRVNSVASWLVGVKGHCTSMWSFDVLFFFTAPVNVQFADEVVVNSEGDLSMAFELVLSGPVNNPFDVEVCTRNGSALG